MRMETPNGALGETFFFTAGTYFCRLAQMSSQVSPG